MTYLINDKTEYLYLIKLDLYIFLDKKKNRIKKTQNYFMIYIF